MKLWVDDQREAPEGWTRARSLAEAERALRSGKVRHVALGGSDLFCETVAAALEAGAFTGRIRPCDVDLRGEHPAAAAALEKATKHWSALPKDAPPPAVPAKRGRRNVLAAFLLWHLLGFAGVFLVYEAWHLWRHGTHAPWLQWVIRKAK